MRLSKLFEVEFFCGNNPQASILMRLVQIAEEIVSVLISDPNAMVKVIVEISADFPERSQRCLKTRRVSRVTRGVSPCT
jgi:uncharacterized protein